MANYGIAIVVYFFQTFARGGEPLYNGTDFVINTHQSVSHTLRIMFYENSRHYQPILNLIGASGSVGYCIPCNRGYTHLENHRCSNKCYKCMKIPACDPTAAAYVRCSQCNRTFFGQDCYANHLTQTFNKKGDTVCKSLQICNVCFKTVRPMIEKFPHKCGYSFCKICKQRLPIRHFCYLQPIASNDNENENENDDSVKDTILYLFYDFETQQTVQILGDPNKKLHVPNLCVVQQVCSFCLDKPNILERCEFCGIREYVFNNDPVQEFVSLVTDFSKSKNFKQIICIAHNSQSFDAQFILKYLVEKYDGREKVSVILNGSKIILMKILKIKFIDSLNYFHMPLSSLPKAFGLPELEKGYFPHLFNRPENANYVGAMPDSSAYSPDRMSTREREKFLEWYDARVRSEYVFDFRTEIVKYCKLDVEILRLACMAFRKMFVERGVDPFAECTTIASTCMRVFRKRFLKEKQIGILPVRGYRGADRQSIKALTWMLWQEREVLRRPVQHAGCAREKRLDEGILVDGYCEPRLWGPDAEDHKGIVLQFQGCFWHACPFCYTINRDTKLRSGNGDTMDERYERTCAISAKIKHHNYRLIEIWECQYDAELAQNERMRQFVEENTASIRREPLDPRDAFFGGRTGNTARMYQCAADGSEIIKYVDVNSLYPYICKYGKFPLGHPKIYSNENECRRLVGDNYDVSRVDGLIKCEILPPRNLYHPVLPVRAHGKLLFPLCRTCCEQLRQSQCCHEDEAGERALRGTWVSEEVRRAVELGYRVLRIYEIWQYEMTQYNSETGEGGIFAEYINEFYKLKIAASGWPANCTSDDEKQAFLARMEREEGVKLNMDEMDYNPGLRFMAKLALNSLWGKIAQRDNMTQTEIVKEAARLMRLLTSAEVVLESLLPVNDETLYANWYYENEALRPVETTNVVVAAFVTAQARLKLHAYLHKLDRRAIYYDTDSVVYVSRGNVDEDLPVGSMLGELTDELVRFGGDGTYIEAFLSAGPKFYAFQYKTPTGEEGNVQKIKGIKLNHENQKKINFETIRQMILGETRAIVVDTDAIRRTAFHDVITQPETKTCRVTAAAAGADAEAPSRATVAKRVFPPGQLTESFPYGYKSDDDDDDDDDGGDGGGGGGDVV